MRFVAFLDILGFSEHVGTTELQKLLTRLSAVNRQGLKVARRIGRFQRDADQYPDELLSFSFSDTFILCSLDDSDDSFAKIVIGSFVLTRMLFGQGFPVRGAITLGEAEAVPETSHFAGKAIVRAALLEKSQDWFGVIVDPEIITPAREELLKSNLLGGITLRYAAPFKKDSPINGEVRVINWRMNLRARLGIRSLFLNPKEERAALKLENTLTFCRFLRQNSLIEYRPPPGFPAAVWQVPLYPHGKPTGDGPEEALEDGL